MATTIATNAKQNKPPAYRLRKGYSQAIVTLTDAPTGRRKDYWLGEHGTPASWEAYHRLLAQWESRGRHFPPPLTLLTNGHAENAGPTLNELGLAYWKHAVSYYTPAAAGHIKIVLRLARSLFGHTPAAAFGPNDLRLVRDAMIKGDPKAKPRRKPWSRGYTNSQVHRLCRLFNWGASLEMVPVEVYHRLKSVAALRRGKSEAKETEPVTPVSLEQVESVRRFLSRQVRALVDLQRLTGARGGELFKLRPVDLHVEESKDVWTVTLADHKMAHAGKRRTLHFGPKAQKVIQPFLVGRPVHTFLFSPAEAMQEHHAERSRKRKAPSTCGNSVGTNRVINPKKKPGECYSSSSYRQAIERACERAGVPSWHPHQLRHTTATLIRKEFGLEAASVVLGHSSAVITDSTYAARDLERVVDVMRLIG